MKKVLITGVNGSCASYLAEYIVSNNLAEVHGISRWHTDRKNKNFKDVIVHECDLLDLGNIIRTFDKIQPEIIFHLASNANVRLSFETPHAILNNNVNGTLNLLEALRITKIKPLVQFCGTSEVYGKISSSEGKVDENHNVDPVNVYAISKLTQELLVKSYFNSYDIPTIVTRAFGYINPRRPDIFSSAFAKQLVAVEKKLQDKIYHGNLDSIRTLLDVRDVCKAYWLAATKCVSGEVYNIGSEDPISVKDFLNKLTSKSNQRIICEEDKELLRPIDITFQIPDTTKFKATTSFKPDYVLDESIDFLLDYYRNQ